MYSFTNLLTYLLAIANAGSICHTRGRRRNGSKLQDIGRHFRPHDRAMLLVS